MDWFLYDMDLRHERVHYLDLSVLFDVTDISYREFPQLRFISGLGVFRTNDVFKTIIKTNMICVQNYYKNQHDMRTSLF